MCHHDPDRLKFLPFKAAVPHLLNPFIFRMPYFSPSSADLTFESCQKHDLTPFCHNPPTSPCFSSSVYPSRPKFSCTFFFSVQSRPSCLCFPALPQTISMRSLLSGSLWPFCSAVLTLSISVRETKRSCQNAPVNRPWNLRHWRFPSFSN